MIEKLLFSAHISDHTHTAIKLTKIPKPFQFFLRDSCDIYFQPSRSSRPPTSQPSLPLRSPFESTNLKQCKSSEIHVVKQGQFTHGERIGRITFNSTQTEAYYQPNLTPSKCPSFLVLQKQGLQSKSPLKPDTIIKLGPALFKVLKLPNTQYESNTILTSVTNNLARKVETAPSQQALLCRFCLSTFGRDEGKGIQLCQCRGSCGYVHFECARKWLQFKISQGAQGAQRELPESLYTVMNITQMLVCQICKESIPPSFITENGDLINLLDSALLPIMEKKPLLLQFLNSDHLILVSIEIALKKKVYIGSQASINLVEILQLSGFKHFTPGISGRHCSIYASDGNVILEDEGSDCGTLISMKPYQNYPLKPTLRLQFQSVLLDLSLIFS